MSDTLFRLMEAKGLSPLSYYFARFVARGCGAGPESVLARSAALVSMRNLQGDVCVDLADYAGQPMIEDLGSTNGTYVNRDRVDVAVLAPGDEVIVGRFHLVVALGA